MEMVGNLQRNSYLMYMSLGEVRRLERTLKRCLTSSEWGYIDSDD